MAPAAWSVQSLRPLYTEHLVERSQRIADDRLAGAMSMQEVARLIRRRDARGVDELYRLAGRRAFGLAYRILGDAQLAEDAVQEGFLALWRQAERVDPEDGHVVALLLTIVRRRALDRVRARLPRAGGDGLVEEADHRATAALAAVEDGLTFERVRSSLLELAPEQRAAIEMAYFEGLTHREIAARTGAPLGTVKSRLRLGIERLRAAMGIGSP
ncbi:MAG: sigma-70 family RNA polymerase sigma factor [Dehalococcoidia bacterium]